MVYLDKDYAYSVYTRIEYSTTFYSLLADFETSIASYLYNHVIDKSPKFRKFVVAFSYEEVLNEHASLGTLEKKSLKFEIRGWKRLNTWMNNALLSFNISPYRVD